MPRRPPRPPLFPYTTLFRSMAAREAMVNAGKHAGVDSVDVYAEHLAGELSIFVRDRGAGFDSEAVPEDRHGIRDSIVERMNRRSEEHTSELQSRGHLVCRRLLEQ